MNGKETLGELDIRISIIWQNLRGLIERAAAVRVRPMRSAPRTGLRCKKKSSKRCSRSVTHCWIVPALCSESAE
jgi:hypothetical protein